MCTHPPTHTNTNTQIHAHTHMSNTYTLAHPYTHMNNHSHTRKHYLSYIQAMATYNHANSFKLNDLEP